MFKEVLLISPAAMPYMKLYLNIKALIFDSQCTHHNLYSSTAWVYLVTLHFSMLTGADGLIARDT